MDTLRFLLVAVGLMAAALFNLLYFTYVLPFMWRRKGPAAIRQALLSLILGQIIEYCRFVRDHGSSKQRVVALAITSSLIMVVAMMAFLAVLVVL